MRHAQGGMHESVHGKQSRARGREHPEREAPSAIKPVPDLFAEPTLYEKLTSTFEASSGPPFYEPRQDAVPLPGPAEWQTHCGFGELALRFALSRGVPKGGNDKERQKTVSARQAASAFFVGAHCGSHRLTPRRGPVARCEQVERKASLACARPGQTNRGTCCAWTCRILHPSDKFTPIG